MPTKTPRAKAASATTGTNKTNPALLKPLQPSKELAAVVGPDPLPRGQAVKKVWDYIKKQNLQNPENRREFLADDKLSPIAGKDKVTMFEESSRAAQAVPRLPDPAPAQRPPADHLEGL
jgi:chromatin remodeling complex protein RSC6